MNAAQLRIVLDHVPGDLEIIIPGVRGFLACGHVHEVIRRTNGTSPGPGLVLMAGPVPYYAPCPGPDHFELRGSFRRRDQLLLALDPDIPLGDPHA